MALIECPECKTQVSDAAPACPKCGYPVAHARMTPGGGAPAQPTPGTPAAAAATAPLEEKVVWEGHPSLLVLTPTFLKAGGLALLLLVALLYAGDLARLFGLPGNGDFAHAVVLCAWTGLIATILFVVWRVVVIKCWRYSLSTQRVRWERGVIARALDEIDLRVIDDTDYRQGVVQRLFGIGDVEIHSQNTDLPSFRLRGVRDPRTLREAIRAEAYKVSQRALFMRQA